MALGLLVAPLSPEAQQVGRVWRIGLFHVGLDHLPPPLDALREGLKALGHEEGRNLHFDFRNLADEAAARATAQAFVREGVDLMVAFEDLSVRAAKAATTDIPVVFFYLGDPVADGLVQSFNHPGGNLTGLVAFMDVYAKQMELFKELVPGLRRLLVLLDPTDPATGGVVAEVRRAGAALRLHLVEREATTWADIERVFRSVKRGDVDGVIVGSPTLRLKFPSRLARLIFAKGLPLASERKELVEEGGLFSYAPDLVPMGRVAATYVDKILKGAKPADLPVWQPMRLELVINLKTAKALGLTIPQSVLIRADRVIQ